MTSLLRARALGAAAAGAAVLLLGSCGSGGGDSAQAPAAGSAAEGKTTYAATCAQCHGTELQGTNRGPSFLTPIYAPGHHGDAAFVRAVKSGVQPHHWNFGPMPPYPGVSEAEVADIIAYVRQEQARAGVAR